MLPADHDDLIGTLDPGPGLLLPVGRCLLDRHVLDEERRVGQVSLPDDEHLERFIVVLVETDEYRDLLVGHVFGTPPLSQRELPSSLLFDGTRWRPVLRCWPRSSAVTSHQGPSIPGAEAWLLVTW